MGTETDRKFTSNDLVSWLVRGLAALAFGALCWMHADAMRRIGLMETELSSRGPRIAVLEANYRSLETGQSETRAQLVRIESKLDRLIERVGGK